MERRIQYFNVLEAEFWPLICFIICSRYKRLYYTKFKTLCGVHHINVLINIQGHTIEQQEKKQMDLGHTTWYIDRPTTQQFHLLSYLLTLNECMIQPLGQFHPLGFGSLSMSLIGPPSYHAPTTIISGALPPLHFLQELRDLERHLRCIQWDQLPILTREVDSIWRAGFGRVMVSQDLGEMTSSISGTFRSLSSLLWVCQAAIRPR